MPVLIDLRLPRQPEAAWMARRAVEDLPSRFRTLIDTVQLGVSGLVTNAVLHADLAATEEIRLVVHEGDDRLRVEVIDPGHGRDAAETGWSAIPEGYAFEAPPENNYGLFVVRTLADRSGVLWDHGIVAWFEVDADSR
jgi:anti-sigma regulatory factor (Ser/Thr protein kinase)